MKYILTDVEGTTTSIEFVHKVLFPYSENHLNSFIDRHYNDELIANYLTANKIDKDEFLKRLQNWIETDTKEKILKDIQGLIWEEGYAIGSLKGHVYQDVPVAFKKWTEQGMQIGIYSSGSIWAQKLIFKNSVAGDLDQYISHNFDTSMGPKRDKKSYENILEVLNLQASDVLFLSDIKEELDAAKSSGMKTVQLVRDEDNGLIQGHPKAKTFKEISF